jgi:hypothetical protein
VRAISGSRAGDAIHDAVGVMASDVLDVAGVAAWAGAAIAQTAETEMRHFSGVLIPPSIGKCTEGG